MAVPPEQRDGLASRAVEADSALAGSSPQDVLTWAVDEFGDKFCIAASMADAVLIDMASKIRPGIHVVFLETGYHFSETLKTRDRVAARYPINLQRAFPKQTVSEQDALFGPQLHDRDPDACCNLRKVEPLRRALEPFHAWCTGIRRDQTTNRRTIGVVEWDASRMMVKVNPLAAWSQEQVAAYVLAHDVEVNPLTYRGYPSIGCAPCTRQVTAGADPRSGRWVGSTKTECGLHVDDRAN